MRTMSTYLDKLRALLGDKMSATQFHVAQKENSWLKLSSKKAPKYSAL